MIYCRGALVAVLIILCSFSTLDVQAVESRNCGTDNGVATIEIIVPGSGVVPADQVIQLTAKPRNSNGDEVGASITWGVSNGSIDWTGLFNPWQKGEITVTACSGNAWTNQTVTVLQGETVDVELQLSSHEISTDDVVVLDPRRIDSKGNSAPAFVPTENWSVPEGTSVHQGAEVTWEPMHIGSFTLEMSAYGFVSNATLNVSYGQAVGLTVVGSNEISADDATFYEVNACDSKDNCWWIEGVWSHYPEQQAELLNDTSGIYLSPQTTGLVRLEVTSEVDGNLLMAHKDISISPGEAVLTKVDYDDGTDSGVLSSSVIQVKAGTILELSVTLVDAVGSEWKSENVEWKLNHSSNPQYELFTSSSFNFSSNMTGEWNLMVSPQGGLPSKYSIEVLPGDAASIQVSPTTSTAMRVSAGGSIGLQVIARDVDGNAFPLDVEWLMSDDVGNMSKDTSGSGSYVFTPSRQAYLGTQVLNFTGPLGVQNIAIELVAGELAELAIVFEDGSSGEQGGELHFTIQGRDSNGNHIEVSLDSVSVECSCGKVSVIDDGTYKIALEEHGERHTLSAQMEGLPRAVVYVDVSQTLFSGLLGSNSQVITIGIVITGLLLLLVAVAIYRRSRSEYEDDVEDDEEDIAAPVVATSQLTPQQAPPIAAFGSMTHPPPLAAQPVPQLASAVLPPVAQPTSHHSSQPQTYYDRQPMSHASVIQPTEQSTVSTQTSLSSAKELLTPAQVGTEEVVQESDPVETQEPKEETEEVESPIEDSVDSEEIETVVDESVGKEISSVEQVPEVVETKIETKELELLPSEKGPMTTAGVLLKALPGTEPGKEGWYHGIDSRPYYWDGPQ